MLYFLSLLGLGLLFSTQVMATDQVEPLACSDKKDKKVEWLTCANDKGETLHLYADNVGGALEDLVLSYKLVATPKTAAGSVQLPARGYQRVSRQGHPIVGAGFLAPNEKLKISVELHDICGDKKDCVPPVSAYVQPHSPDEATPAWIVEFLESCTNKGLFGRD